MFHILLAEDNIGDVLLVKRALREYEIPHELHVVQDGGEAIDYVSRMGKPGGDPCPDLVLLDLNLPKADGAQVLTAFRKRPECAQTPVIVVTSSNAQRDRDFMAKLGIACYFRKPSDLDEYMQLGGIVRQFVDA